MPQHIDSCIDRSGIHGNSMGKEHDKFIFSCRMFKRGIQIVIR